MVVRLDTVGRTAFAMELDLENSKLTLEKGCKVLLDNVRDVIKKDELGITVEDREVSMLMYYEKPLFMELLQKALGICREDFIVVGNMLMFKVPRGLDLATFDELMSFEGVVSYLRSKHHADLPWEIKRDVDLLSYFNGCPVCCGKEGLKVNNWSKGNNIRLHIEGNTLVLRDHTYGSIKDTFDVNFCPECGMKVK